MKSVRPDYLKLYAVTDDGPNLIERVRAGSSVALVSAAGIAFAVWAHGQIETFKAQFLGINFEELAAHAEKRKTLYTDSTFWFDIHYLLFGLLVIGVVLLIANAVWKRKLMKEEQALLAGGKEAAV